jgi:mannose-6-phosphate isomerase-like protein (cupin superfamily)
MMKKPVPAVKTIPNSMIFLTEGTANIKIGAEEYSINNNEVLFVTEGHIFSFWQG